MTSQVQICNLALGKLAQDITITSLTERSGGARVLAPVGADARPGAG